MSHGVGEDGGMQRTKLGSRFGGDLVVGGEKVFFDDGQGGNVWEHIETAYDGSNNTAGENRELRGGAWNYGTSETLDASIIGVPEPSVEINIIGFRVAMIPEPSALSFLAIGLGGLAMMRRRRL